jgi:hypothetical protein
VPKGRPVTAVATEAGGVTESGGLILRVLDVSVLVFPGVAALPVSAAVKVKVGLVPPAPLIVPVAAHENVPDANEQENESDGVARVVPVVEYVAKPLLTVYWRGAQLPPGPVQPVPVP